MADTKSTTAAFAGEKQLTEDGNKIIEETAVEGVNPTFAAIMATHKPNQWGKGHLQLYGLCAVIFLNSTMSGMFLSPYQCESCMNGSDSMCQGFDGSLMGSINVLPSYTSYYGLPSTGTASTGIVFAIYQVGQMAAALFVWIADWRGRKQMIFIGTIGVIVGTIITATARTLPIFIGGRFLLAFFATLACSASPLYLVEIAPPQYRGTLAGLYNTFYYFVRFTSPLSQRYI